MKGHPMTMQLKALNLSVYRDANSQADCTNGGVSSTHTRLQLVGYVEHSKGIIDPLPEGVPTTIDPDHDAPVVLHVRHIFGENAVSLVPLTYDPTATAWRFQPGSMAGGNYATGDSRLNELVASFTGNRFHGPIAIHDRYEH